MTLNHSLGAVLDALLAKQPDAEAFTPQRASAPLLRRYVAASDWYQREIAFYRDKRWSKQGGKLYADLNCLVNALQQALTGCAQSLAAVDFAIPLNHFQYRLTARGEDCVWSIHSQQDVADFEQQVGDWMTASAWPWFEQFASMPGVIRFMQEQERWQQLALLQNSLGQAVEAKASMQAWLESLPRQIERPLQELADVGLLSADAAKLLMRASLQEESRYRSLVESWLASSP